MFEQLLVKIGSSLDSASIPYMIIGGQAVLLYGEPRLTRDIDITYIKRWLKEFDATVKGKDFLICFEETLKELRPQNEDN